MKGFTHEVVVLQSLSAIDLLWLVPLTIMAARLWELGLFWIAWQSARWGVWYPMRPRGL